MAERLRSLNSIFSDDLQTIPLENPALTAGAAAFGTCFRAEAEMVDQRISSVSQRLDRRLDMLFDINSELGRRLNLAELRIFDLETQLQEIKDSGASSAPGSSSGAAPVSTGHSL